jgi:hypothetical protein
VLKGNVGKSRALLDKARLKIPKNPHLWLCTIRNELAADNRKIALQLLAQAMQECPKCATSALRRRIADRLVDLAHCRKWLARAKLHA